MSETILTAQTVDGFALNEAFGCYAVSVRDVPCNVTPGQEYTVVWDSVEYVRKAVAFTSAEGFAGVYIGNTLVEGKANSGEPFAIVYDIDNSYLHYMALDASASHTVAVYTVTTEIGVIVKDRTGKDVEHKGAVGVRVRTLDGSTKDFIDSDTVPDPVEKEVQLDFSAGGMTILPNEGEVFSKVTIPQPAALIPENIRENEVVAGLIGALIAGKELKITSGTAGSATLATSVQVEHGLGVAPDLVIVSSGGAFTYTGTDAAIFDYAISMSYALKNAIGSPIAGLAIGKKRLSSGGFQISGGKSTGITGKYQENFTGIWLGNDTTFTFGASGSAKVYGTHYTWVAVAGLV